MSADLLKGNAIQTLNDLSAYLRIQRALSDVEYGSPEHTKVMCVLNSLNALGRLHREDPGELTFLSPAARLLRFLLSTDTGYRDKTTLGEQIHTNDAFLAAPNVTYLPGQDFGIKLADAAATRALLVGEHGLGYFQMLGDAYSQLVVTCVHNKPPMVAAHNARLYVHNGTTLSYEAKAPIEPRGLYDDVS